MRIYQPFFHEANIILDDRNRHHVVNVMRCRENDYCYVFDGQGNEVKTKIVCITKKEVVLDILECVENHTESPLKIHLFQALCKGEKMDWIMQKAVELGVTEITPISTERCDVKLSQDRLEKKYEHWRNIIISATEQSGRAVLPMLHSVTSLQEAILSSSDTMQILLTPAAKNNFPTIEEGLVPVLAIFIGPEGGFSNTEIDFALTHNVQNVTLGKRILRTETASLAVIASLQMLYGDFL